MATFISKGDWEISFPTGQLCHLTQSWGLLGNEGKWMFRQQLATSAIAANKSLRGSAGTGCLCPS